MKKNIRTSFRQPRFKKSKKSQSTKPLRYAKGLLPQNMNDDNRQGIDPRYTARFMDPNSDYNVALRAKLIAKQKAQEAIDIQKMYDWCDGSYGHIMGWNDDAFNDYLRIIHSQGRIYHDFEPDAVDYMKSHEKNVNGSFASAFGKIGSPLYEATPQIMGKILTLGIPELKPFADLITAPVGALMHGTNAFDAIGDAAKSTVTNLAQGKIGDLLTGVATSGEGISLNRLKKLKQKHIKLTRSLRKKKTGSGLTQSLRWK